jgi:diacylglycerol kinase (ATP)
MSIEVPMTGKRSSFVVARLMSFAYAIRGLFFLIQSQANARIHLAATIAVMILSYFLHITNSEWCLIILAMTLVWITEALNTAIECLTDLVSPEYHLLAGRTKDVAAAAVLLAALGAIAVGGIVFIPYLRRLS